MSASYYESLSDSELASQTAELEERIAQIKARGLKLNMARGKPSSEQLDLSRPMLDVLKSDAVLADGGVDCANYGCLEGIPSCRKFFGDILGVPADNVLIGGESSLTLMYDAVSHAMVKGVCGADPMLLQMQARKLKWICLVPGYDRHFGIVSQFGFECVCVPLGEDGIRGDALSRTPSTVLHITPFRSFPTGITASASKRSAYIRWASEGDRYIVEDDFESEFSLLRKPEETVFSRSERQNVIYMNTFSRTISSSLRVGYMVLPRALLPLFCQRVGFYSCTVPAFEQYVLAELIDSGDFERHINRMRRKKRRMAAEN